MQTRTSISLNDGWQFVRGRMSRKWLAEASVAPNVTLPHCWNEHDGFQEGVAYYRGWGSYRRVFRARRPADGAEEARWFLESDGFYGTGEVLFNGRRLGAVDGQYLGFRMEVTAVLRFDEPNVLGIRLTNRCGRDVLPGLRMPDFLLYGGLSGEIRLVREPALRLNGRDLVVRCTAVGDARADVTVAWGLDGAGNVQAGDTVEWRLTAPDGGDAGRVETVLVAGQDRGMAVFHVLRPQRWGIEMPQRYQAEGRLMRGGRVLDSLLQPFGVRSAEFRPGQGFFLNGERVELRGCNRHESMPGFGRALPRWQHEEDARLLKAMGLNFVRLSHYPQHPAFLEACDRLGILVYAELASWKSVRGGGWLRRARLQLAAMIRRDRNHPCVILWGIGNEGRHAGAFRVLYELCKALDPSRPVTYAENHLYRARRCGTVGLPDVWGLNYEFDAMEEGIAASRLRCAVVSECSNYPHTRRGDADAERIQLDTVKGDLERMAGRMAVAGFALWCFNDYATLRKKRYRRFSGVMDGWRTPKAAARWLSSTYGDGRLAAADRPDPAAGPGAAVVLEYAGGEVEEGGGTAAVQVRVMDAQGRQSAWTGELTAGVTSGPGRIRSFDGRGTVWVADGLGRIFASGLGGSGSSGEIRVDVSGEGLSSGVMILAMDSEVRR
jgi:hypothetical protein